MCAVGGRGRCRRDERPSDPEILLPLPVQDPIPRSQVRNDPGSGSIQGELGKEDHSANARICNDSSAIMAGRGLPFTHPGCRNKCSIDSRGPTPPSRPGSIPSPQGGGNPLAGRIQGCVSTEVSDIHAESRDDSAESLARIHSDEGFYRSIIGQQANTILETGTSVEV